MAINKPIEYTKAKTTYDLFIFLYYRYKKELNILYM